MAKAIIPVADGFEEIEAISIIDVLRRGGVEVVTASISGNRTVRGAHNVEMTADAIFDAVKDEVYDAIILPGGSDGTNNLKESESLKERLRRQQESQGLICAICAAPMVLVAAGVLDEGIEVTCYPTCQMELDRSWVDQPVVAHGNVITSQAPGTAMLFALVILQQLAGRGVAERVARNLVTSF